MRRRLPGGRPATPHSVPALITALAGLAIALTWWRHPAGALVGAVGWFPALGLTVALAAAGYFHVEYRHGADEDVNAIDLFEAALAPALLLLPGPGLLVAVVAGRLASETLLRVRPLKIAFNVAAWAAAAALGSAVLDLLGDGRRGATGDPDELVALAAAMAVATLVNQLAFVTVLRLAGRRTLAGVLAELGPAILPAWIVGGGVILTFGLLFAAACSWVPALAWLLPAPLAALYWASQGYAASRAALARTSLLHRASRDLATSAAGPEQIRTFLEGVRHAFEASAVHLVTAVDGALHVQGSPRAATDRGDDLVDPDLAAALAALPGPQRVTVLSPDDAIASGLRRHGWRDGLAVPVRAPERTEAVLCVFDPKGVVTSEDSELAVVEGLTAELGGVLARAEVEAGLRRSEARFRTLVQEASDVVVVIDAAWVVSDVLPSPVPSPILSEPGEEITDGAHPDDVDGMISCLSHLADRPGATGSFTWRAPGREGSWRHLETMATNLLDDPAVGGIVLISRDVTERVLATELAAGQAEALGRISRRRPLTETVASLARAMEAQAPAARLTVALFVEAPEPVVEHGASLPAPLIQGLSASLASERPAGEGRARPTTVVADVDADERWAALAPGGEVRSVWAAPITRSEGSDAIGVAAVHFDHPCTPGEADLRVLHSVADLVHIAVEAVRAEARLVHQASHDPLTGLPNRVLFLDRTAVAISRLARSTRTVAVLFVDLDRFKTVNDSLGHEVGDRLLIELARRLEGAMRPSDTVARFGGDEFTILCDDIPDPHEAVVIAARVREALATPVHLEGHDLYVTASIGIAHTSDRSRPPHELVEEADAAMYEAKAAGGDVHRVYDEAVRSRAMLDLVTYQALREAISGDELRLHYQPVVDLVTGRIVGAEALVRWDHSRLGLLGPDQFIPFAEATGLIVPIGALVLTEACAQRQRWAGRADSAFAVWVNLSARQFADPDLVTTITTALEESGASPSVLVLEITESALMEHAEATLVTLRTLHDLGVRIVIDDFGTGYSSLSYLKRFPVDALKIDKSFVAGLGVDRDDEAIVGSVINLAHNLGMTAVAEGVETDDQLDLLRGLRCDVVQGFRFSRPVPADEISFERPLDRPRQGLLDLRDPVHRRA